MRKMLMLGISIITIVIFNNCSTGKKALEKGNYYDAVMKSVDRLRSAPDSKKSAQTLEAAYPKMLDYYQNRLKQAIAIESRFKWADVASLYADINRTGDEIMRCPAALQIIPAPKMYNSELAKSRELAAQSFYEAGLESLELKTKASAREAFGFFEKAQSQVPGYKEVQNLLLESEYLATYKIIVEPAQVQSQMYQLSVDFFNQKIMEYLYKVIEGRKFVRFYTPQEAETYKINEPDQVIDFHFLEFTVGNTKTTERIYEVKRDSVHVGDTRLPDGKTLPVFGTVKAKINSVKAELISGGVLEMDILDYKTKRLLKKERMPGQYIWKTEWASFNGDERALSKQELDMCNRKQASPPPPQQLFIEFTRPIYDQVQSRLREFYRSY